MHFHLPKPLHGWREFAGEVGIIVVGVLIALGAEQVVEWIHSNRQVRETREALDAELDHNLAVFRRTAALAPCVDARLKEIDSILAHAGSGRMKLAHDIVGPVTLSMHFAVWDAASGEGRSLLPLQVKLRYAELYDIMHRYDAQRAKEADRWADIEDLDLSAPLSPRDRQQGKAAVRRLRRMGALIPGYASLLEQSASPLKLRPTDVENGETRTLLARNASLLCSRLI